jgi:hypothetical protein
MRVMSSTEHAVVIAGGGPTGLMLAGGSRAVGRRRVRGDVGSSSNRRVTAPTAVLIRPDGYVAWVGDQTQPGLAEALATCSDRLPHRRLSPSSPTEPRARNP